LLAPAGSDPASGRRLIPSSARRNGGSTFAIAAAASRRVADIKQTDADWTAKGIQFLTPPKDHGAEIRAYVRDPDGHLIEVGQATGIVAR
jgi:catechol 2,3-dioxygenase-like lactoylglutathione lyase family enzyme